MPTRAERWLLQMMAERGRALLDAEAVLVVVAQRGELHVRASAPERFARTGAVPIEGSALGALFRAGNPVAFERPLGSQADWLRELGLDARPALIQPFGIDGEGGGMMIALGREDGFDRRAESAIGPLAARLAEYVTAERRAETERLRAGAEARERERSRWARELHDETVQGLGALRMQLANARDSGDGDQLSGAVERVLEGLDREVVGIRHLITELRPAALDDLGLEAALAALARRAHDVYGLDVSTEVALASSHERLDPELETTIYRVVQEGLSNASRHAHATQAQVSVAERDGTVVAEVRDNGRGLARIPAAGGDGEAAREEVRPAGEAQAGREGGGPPGGAAAPTKAPGGFGLPGMRERAELVGGELALESPGPGEGTTLRLTVPLAGRGAYAQAPGDGAAAGA
jgi:signal transduction histidine kinase